MPLANVPVQWQIAEDEAFRKVVRKGRSMATPALAHSVHAEVGGLKPGRWYWYRFNAAGHQSPVGRFRTAPAPGSTPDKFRFAFASCQQWTQGLWTAYQHMAEEDIELVIHLGDYIYEQGYRGTVRNDGHEETFTLADYRNRHALYKTDPLLQKAHARFPWITTWDDHEVSNNYANDIQEKGQSKEDFLKRRAWAYQAFYEHLPLRMSSLPQGPNMLLHRQAEFGKLVRLHMLDTRQYRSDQPCGDGLKKACGDLRNPAQTLLGEQQEKWLAESLRTSQATWDLLGQQIFVTLQDFDPGPDEVLNMDSWSGYPLARQRLVDTLAARTPRNTVIITGDVHSSWVGQLHQEAQNVKSPCLAAEFITTSISSGGDGADTNERSTAVISANPQIRYFNGRRGYVRCEVSAKSWRTDYRAVDYVAKAGAPIQTKASFQIEPGRLTVEKA
jgi:alkaline phosphatase D